MTADLTVNQLIAALVALLKRGWLDHPDQRQEFFQADFWMLSVKCNTGFL